MTPRSNPACVDFDRQPTERIAAAIAEAAGQGCLGFVELLRAAAARQISLTTVFDRRFQWTPRMLKSADRPTVVLLSDDAGDPRNPDEWRCSISAIAWARCAVIHGTGAESWHYKAVIEAARVKGRVLMVETDSHHAMAWTEAIRPRQIPNLCIVPPPGDRHPAVTA